MDEFMITRYLQAALITLTFLAAFPVCAVPLLPEAGSLQISIISTEGTLLASCLGNDFAPCTLTLNSATPAVPGFMVVRNNSTTRTATNIRAEVPFSDITQIPNGSCTNMLPGSICSIRFNPSLMVTHPPTLAIIKGDNTISAQFYIEVI